MYVFVSPCILNSKLRANGITSDDDIHIFEVCRKRCEEFDIDIIPLPCPETIFLGNNREPGNFVDRMDTPEFYKLLDELEEKVRKIISEKGEPLCVVGVNSSPTCGVDTTYYTSEKSAGAGVFLKRFSDLKLVDAKVFARYKVYLAAPLFSQAERRYNSYIAEILKNNFFKVFSPQDSDDTAVSRIDEREKLIYENNISELNEADVVVGIIDGADADSGTAWEMGYAFALSKKVVALRTDFRKFSKNEHVNLMLETEAEVVENEKELIEKLF
ncbi:MAG: nucleoside 2-deoxyribosyltransferase [Methanocorpusculum sp.]|nr:nucleoside 2-deoxyribosyltransferase [Methanocorpusculum sp.]